MREEIKLELIKAQDDCLAIYSMCSELIDFINNTDMNDIDLGNRLLNMICKTDGKLNTLRIKE